MRKSALTVLVAAAILAAVPASASTCLRLREIKDTVAPDGKTLIVTMINGKVWHNKLVGSCSELKYQGFTWVAHNDEVCDRENTLRVINSGQICQLGVFVPAPPPKMTKAPPG